MLCNLIAPDLTFYNNNQSGVGIALEGLIKMLIRKKAKKSKKEESTKEDQSKVKNISWYGGR